MMHLGVWAVIVSSLIIFVSSVVLLWSKTYDEGLIGHLGLGVLIFSSVITLGGIIWGDVQYSFLPESVLGRAGAAAFLASVMFRHLGWFCKERRSIHEKSQCKQSSFGIANEGIRQ